MLFRSVGGAAAATIISQFVSGALCLIVIIKKYPELHVQKHHFKWSGHLALKHLRIGAPMAFQFSITAIGVIVLQGSLNKFGPATIAAFTAANKVEQLIAVAAGSFGVVMANYTGQNFGAGNLDRIKKGTFAGSVLTLGFSFLAMGIALIFPEGLTSLFIEGSAENATQVLKDSGTYLRITGIFYPFLFMIFIYRNVLQAMGKTFMPLMAGVFELFARSICAFTLPLVMGYAGICLAGPIAWLSSVIPLCIAYFYIIKKRMPKDMEILRARA